MRMSSDAIDRLVEERLRDDPELSVARTLSDEELLEELRPLFGDLDRETFRQLCVAHVSALEMLETGGVDFDEPGQLDPGALSLAAKVLWERWAPDVPSFHMIDVAMQAGYHAPDTATKCEIWLDVWSKVLAIADRRGITTLSKLDELSGASTEFLYNWIQDLEMELGNGYDLAKQFRSERLRFCEEYVARFGEEHPEIDRGMWRAIAEAHHLAGDVETVDRLYREWLTADPGWGWGWVGWSDCYWLFTQRKRDFQRGEEILREGLAVAELRDRADVLDRLAELYAESGRPEEERKVRKELEALRGVSSPPPQGSQASPQVVGKKIGRNEPCPCGSGKKYKKCCGRS